MRVGAPVLGRGEGAWVGGNEAVGEDVGKAGAWAKGQTMPSFLEVWTLSFFHVSVKPDS